MKKFLSIILMVVVTAASFTFTSAAQQADYTQTLEAVKKLLDVPEYNDFNCTVSDDNNYYTFRWNNNDSDKKRLTISTDKDLNITKYNKYEEPVNEENIIDYEKAKSIADEFLKKVTGENYKYYKLDADETRQLHSLDLYYDTFVNGYRVYGGGAHVSVDLRLGCVIDYSSYFGRYDKNVSSDKPISVGEAKNGLFSEGNVDFVYKNIYVNKNTYLNRETVAKPLYRVKNVYVNAVNGKLKGEDGEEFNEDVVSGGSGYSAVTSESKLTDSEIAEIEKLDKLANAEEISKLIESKFNIKVSADEIKCTYSRGSDETYYTYFNVIKDNITYMHGTVTSDKEISYFNYDLDTIVSGKENIISYIKSIYPSADLSSDISPEENNKNYRNLYIYTAYNKYNGIKDLGSYITICYDEEYNVSVIYYEYNISEHKYFERELTNDEIFDIATENMDFELMYIPDKNRKLKLYYGFEENFSVDASNKEFLDYSGYKPEAEEFNSYIDVAGTWYENIVNPLINSGYRFSENKFEGDKIVTGKDIVQFFENLSVEEYKERTYNNEKFIEYADNPDKEITRYEMAKIIVEDMGFEDLAKKAEFVKPFSDVNDENIANVAICKAYGIVKGVNNMFCGDEFITRAEMASMVYNYVMNK